MKTMLDRGNTIQIKNFDRMVVELSRYMTEAEIDQCVEFMASISDSKWDINPSITESATQIELIIGRERYQQCKLEWSKRNQHLIPDGKKKFINKATGVAYDGLDPEDKPEDYQEITV